MGKMNYLVKLFLSLGIFVSTLASCSSEADITESITPTITGQGPKVELSFEATEEEIDEARVININLGNDASYPKLHSDGDAAGSEIPVTFYIWNGVDGHPATVHRTKLKRITGRKYKFKEYISLATGSDLTNGDWYITGVLNGDMYATDNRLQAFGQQMSVIQYGASSVIGMNIPFTMPWIKLNLTGVGTSKVYAKLATPATFKLRGNIIRVAVRNTSNSSMTVKGWRVKTNQASMSGHWDPFLSIGKPQTGHHPWFRTWAQRDAYADFHNNVPITIPANQRLGYLIMWAMPFNNATPETKFYLRRTDGVDIEVYSSNKSLQEWGKPYRLTGTWAETWNPLTCVAEYNVASREAVPFRVGLDTWNENLGAMRTNKGLVYLDRAGSGSHFLFGETSMFHNITLDGVNYHLPTANEAKVLAPEPTLILTPGYENKLSVTEANVQIQGQLMSFSSDFRNMAGGTLSYGLRFKSGDNAYLTAYRWQKVGSSLIITARYLGSGFTGSIDNVATDAFWASGQEADVVRTLPLGGYIGIGPTSDGTFYHYDRTDGYYWLKDATNSHGTGFWAEPIVGWNITINTAGTRTWPNGTAYHADYVRLFRDC